MEEYKDRIEEVMNRRRKVIMDYLRAYHSKYPLDALKKKILDSGYTKRELDLALWAVGLSKPPISPAREVERGSQEKFHGKIEKIENLAERRMDEKEKTESKNKLPNISLAILIHKNKKKIIIGAILSLVVSLLTLIIYKRILVSFISFFVFFGLFFLYDYFRKALAESSRITKIEFIFPDFLQLMASNLRAGMTIDRSILMSARPEFSPLDKEIMTVGKDIATGKTLESALMDMTKRIKSEKVEKTVFLIISGIRAGGNLSILLEETSRNMRKRGFVEKRASSNVLMYVIFIFVAACIGAPVLFSLSTLLVETLINTISSMQGIETMASSSVPFTFSAVNVSLDFIKYFSIVFIIMTDVLASLVLGLVGKGEEREGVKYIIPMTLISLVLFFALRYLLAGFVVNLMG